MVTALFIQKEGWPIERTSSLQVAILISGYRPTSGSVGSKTRELGVVESVGVATGISQILQSSHGI